LTSRERVKRSLNHQEPDRVPIDFGGTVVTCMDGKALDKLRNFLGIEGVAPPVIDYTMGTVEPDDEIRKYFHSDFLRLSMNVTPPTITENVFEDGFGRRYKKAVPHAYFDVIYSPLYNADVKAIKSMFLPDPDDPRLYRGLAEAAKDLYENTDFALVADFGVPGFYETAQKLRGYENFACDLLVDKEVVFALFDTLLELQKRYFQNYLSEVGGYVEVIGYADDLGMQDRPQISPETYHEMIMPYHTEIFAYIHELADVKILLHSCGAVYPLLEDLIKAGVDVLNPVQTRAAGMNPFDLKCDFGDRLSFWGGFDEQMTLPRGTVKEIEEEVLSLFKSLAPGGGYIFAPSHNIQEDTPPENIVAMYEAAYKYGKYAVGVKNRSIGER
jgi:uroporphyrinogen decarboxylase